MNSIALDELVRRALCEDIGSGDITSEAIFAREHQSEGYLLAKQDMVLAGSFVFQRVWGMLDERIELCWEAAEGQSVVAGQILAKFAGATRVLLSGERVALNLLQRMSGIATAARQYQAACGTYRAVITDTRKTTPGLRMLEKYAVRVGGASNHRYGLDSMVLIKDNHIAAAGGICAAVAMVRQQVSPFVKIEVETETLAQVGEALTAGVDIVMLDNMSTAAIQTAVQLIDGRALVEVSGNVTLSRVPELAACGVDLISCGALTHSAAAADISLKLQRTTV